MIASGRTLLSYGGRSISRCACSMSRGSSKARLSSLSVVARQATSLQTVTLSKRTFSVEIPVPEDTMERAAELMYLGKEDEAEVIFRKILQQNRTTLGDTHIDTLRMMGNLTGLLCSRGSIEEAELLCREAVDGLLATVGQDHRDTLGFMGNLGNILLEQSKYEESESMLRTVHENQMKTLGRLHEDTLHTISNIGTDCFLW